MGPVGFWKDVFGPPKERLIQKGHPQLGLLEFDPDNEGWVTTIPGQPIRFVIGGDTEPNARLMESAAKVLERRDAFQHDTALFLERCTSQQPLHADEIRRLVASEVCFFWPHRPESAMVFFSGPNVSHAWHCDYDAGRLAYLTFDS